MLFTVTTDGLYGAASKGFFAESAFVIRLGLLVDVGVAAVIIALEVGMGRFAAQVTVNALIVNVVGSCYVLSVFVCGVGHRIVWVRGADSKT